MRTLPFPPPLVVALPSACTAFSHAGLHGKLISVTYRDKRPEARDEKTIDRG